MDNTGSGLDRRRFLQATALAGATVVSTALLKPGTAVADTRLPAAVPAEWVFEGRILRATESVLTVLQDGSERSIAMSARSQLWRGGAVSPPAFAQGSQGLVRLAADGTLDAAWGDLSRVTGRVVSASIGEVHVDTGNGIRAVRVGDRPLESTSVAGLSAAYPLVDVGWLLDAIGYDEKGTLIATSADVRPDGIQPASARPAQPQDGAAQSVSPDGVCYNYYDYYGSVTHYTCATGAGRCATCSTSRSDQCAWPTIGTTCHVSSTCKPQVQLPCGAAVTVVNECTGVAASIIVADCGPNKNNYCTNHCATCGLDYVSPVCDLTTPTFARFASPTAGCFPGKVTAKLAC